MWVRVSYFLKRYVRTVGGLHMFEYICEKCHIFWYSFIGELSWEMFMILFI
jgi:hypothetical protein